jgi:hypothetical protein
MDIGRKGVGVIKRANPNEPNQLPQAAAHCQILGPKRDLTLRTL